ncbi:MULTISPECIES: signal peptide peptidase SppA [Bacillaceae]|uniref:signal peptide peptidase SppA n=1 Tax=Bacillaceae TaxID=186817 RepID=UPI0006F53958|nr:MULTISPECIES: signal peptide peptidase SppA [Bacillaceae]KQL32607.1 signal peptide peptidase SppA [Psychrobacillus sp. FJAT-21963]MDF2067886.1 signal peptide peptidase SppA [Bacillus sp. Cr_A10]
MNMKRWFAILGASVLLAVSIFVNTLSSAFSTDWTAMMEEFASVSSSEFYETVIEEGNMNERVALLTVNGVIQDTGSTGSLFATETYNHQFFLEQLEQAKTDESVKAIVLQVNSPGGGVVESAQIYKEIREIQEEAGKPVYVSMGSMAASGGYYISASADKIFVNKETITGSIGVIMQSVNYGKLAEKYGVEFVTIKSGPYKDIMSPSREMTEEERELLQVMLNDSYEDFVDIIEQGRNMTEAEVKKVADGRIVNGRQAVEAGLADEIGFIEDVIQAIKTDNDLEDAEVFEYGYSPSFSSLFAMKAQSFFGVDMESKLIGKLIADNSAPRMMYLYGE